MNSIIFGGAGFLGTNLAEHLLKGGHKVRIFDNLSRVGTLDNLNFLLKKYPENLKFIPGDIRYDIAKMEEAAQGAEAIFHLAAQVAVTTSVSDPRTDFEINALGTFNVLEMMRKVAPQASLIFTSTNKVYGKMEDVEVFEENGRYRYKNILGIAENYPLDFHSPYGCSKGAADQYVRDYARIYNLKTVVFRCSCMYGPHQFGIEDQGWVAWFVISSLFNHPLTIYGDGKQVRDVLYISDVISGMLAAIENIEKTRGQVYNFGGGPENTLSILETIDFLEKYFGKKIEYSFSDWRAGDQKVYISDISKARSDFGFKPQVSPQFGLPKLINFVQENRQLFENKGLFDKKT